MEKPIHETAKVKDNIATEISTNMFGQQVLELVN